MSNTMDKNRKNDNKNHIRDAELLERIVLYVSEQVGNTFSARSISRFLKNQGRSISAETVYNYLNGLTDAYLVHRVSRYDLRLSSFAHLV